jgi:hypothetical protein
MIRLKALAERMVQIAGLAANAAAVCSVRLENWWRGVHPKRIEAVGILIVLTAALWEVFGNTRDERTVDLGIIYGP